QLLGDGDEDAQQPGVQIHDATLTTKARQSRYFGVGPGAGVTATLGSMIRRLLTRLMTRLLRPAPPAPAQVRALFGLPRPPGTCGCLLDLPHDPSAHPAGP
ncbi:hypothetical protein ACWCSD_41575, partial [Nonomuraea sp. NPDC001684]